MNKLRSGIFVYRLQKIKTDKNQDFAFGKVLLVKLKLFSKQLTPFDMDSGKRIVEMQMFNEKDKAYHLVDINSIIKIKGGFGVRYLDD